MERSIPEAQTGAALAGPTGRRPDGIAARGQMTPSFEDDFVTLFNAHFHRLYRYLNRLSGESELAADLAQEAFVRLYARRALPEAPEAWLISVAMNLLRNVTSQRARRRRLLTISRAEAVQSDPPPSPAQAAAAAASRERVRTALDTLPERERQMLLLRAEGYSYRDIAAATKTNESSIGTLLARAKRAFREAYEDDRDAP